jgi:hypothetical protein
MPKRGAQNDVCSSDNIPGVYGLNSTDSTDNITMPALSRGLTTPDDGLLLASRLSYNWVVLWCRRA